MLEIASEADNELARLEERAKKLAREKAHLNLLIHMMGQMSAVTGLENAVANLLQVILNNIGGVNLVLYYWIDDNIYYADVFGKKAKLAAIDDASVAQVVESRIFFEQEHDFRDTNMITPAFTKAQTWVIPLLVGPDLIAVLKIEGLHIGTEALKQQLPTFFSYVALLLKNEILGYTRLQQAYNQLSETHAALTVEMAERKRAESQREAALEALRNSEESYRELSIVDALTQLYNSRHFYNQLKMGVDRVNRYKEHMSLILLDVDNFKAFNDAYGHVEGDQVLIRLSQVLKRCLRQTDSAYRYGGEEFTILMPMTTSEEGVFIAERIRTEWKKENLSPAPDKGVYLTVSIGLAQYRQQEEMKVFVHRVDQLMYVAKKNGKDRVCADS